MSGDVDVDVAVAVAVAASAVQGRSPRSTCGSDAPNKYLLCRKHARTTSVLAFGNGNGNGNGDGDGDGDGDGQD